MAGVFLNTKTYFGTINAVQNRRGTKLLELPIQDKQSVDSLSSNEISFIKKRLAESEDRLLELTRQAREDRLAGRSGNAQQQALRLRTQISQIKFATLVSVLFENKLTLTDNWLINLAEIENLIEKRIRTELNEKLVQAKLERSLIERSKSNFRICLLCGTSNCKTINSCMVTSD